MSHTSPRVQVHRMQLELFILTHHACVHTRPHSISCTQVCPSYHTKGTEHTNVCVCNFRGSISCELEKFSKLKQFTKNNTCYVSITCLLEHTLYITYIYIHTYILAYIYITY